MIDGHFEVNIYINQSTFANHVNLIDELKKFAALKKDKVAAIKLLGDFDVSTSPHKNILRMIEEGKGIAAYQFIAKIKIQKEFSKI